MTQEFAHHFHIRPWEIELMTDGEVREHVGWLERNCSCQRGDR